MEFRIWCASTGNDISKYEKELIEFNLCPLPDSIEKSRLMGNYMIIIKTPDELRKLAWKLDHPIVIDYKDFNGKEVKTPSLCIYDDYLE